jgi:ribosomal protein S18 acetylase RimI-like enzyme
MQTINALTIRRCTIDDAPALSALARRTFYDTFTGTCTEEDMQDFLDTFYNEDRIRQELSDEADYVFFAMMHDMPVAYLRFLESAIPFPHGPDKKALELNRLYVDKAYKGQGDAHALMNFYLDYAKMGGYRLLWLGVWEHNYRAQAFYRKYGFAPSPYTHPFPIGNTPQTDVWWTREL